MTGNVYVVVDQVGRLRLKTTDRGEADALARLNDWGVRCHGAGEVITHTTPIQGGSR